jgi:hypothetical protein
VQIVNSTGKYQNKFQGGTPDMSHILIFYWFEPVMYLNPVSKFPQTTERPGYFVRFSDKEGDALRFKILKNDLVTVYIELWLDSQQVPVIVIREYHLSQMYKNHLNY